MKAVRLTVVILGAAIFGVLALEGAIHWEEWLLPGDRGHSAAAESTQTPAPSAPSRRSRDGSNEHTPRGHQGLIHGTKGDDVLKGTDARERIDGLAGRDQIIAGSGDDVLIGGADNDLLMGGPDDDTYIIEHHGGGADVIVEESGTDSLQLLGGRLALGSIEFLRHGDDLLIRWDHDRPADAVLVRSWFAGDRYHVERLQMPGGDALAARAKPATLDDLVHFAPAQ